jgi:hypothetical protein
MKKTNTNPTWLARVKSRVIRRILDDAKVYSAAFIAEMDLNITLADESVASAAALVQTHKTPSYPPRGPYKMDHYHVAFIVRHFSRAAAAAAYIVAALVPQKDELSEEGQAFYDHLALGYDPGCPKPSRRKVARGMVAYATDLRWDALAWAAEAAYLQQEPAPKTLRVSASCPACLAGEEGEGHFACGASDKLRDATWVCVNGPHLDGDWWVEVQHVGPAGHILAGLDALLAAFQGREPAHPLILW